MNRKKIELNKEIIDKINVKTAILCKLYKASGRHFSSQELHDSKGASEKPSWILKNTTPNNTPNIITNKKMLLLLKFLQLNFIPEIVKKNKDADKIISKKSKGSKLAKFSKNITI